MCIHCDHVLIGFAIKHKPAACPFMAACYCNLCASYGHRPANCEHRPSADCWPAKIAAKAPASQKETGPTLEVACEDRAMRAFLYSKGLSIAGKSDALQDRICEWAGKNSYITVEFK